MQGRAFECPICGAAFTKLDSLIRHEFNLRFVGSLVERDCRQAIRNVSAARHGSVGAFQLAASARGVEDGSSASFRAGETARESGEFRCLDCHHLVHVEEGDLLRRCHHCGNERLHVAG
jgi:DNA-directed RNA polymerase subunit RPC12/RpoP